MDQFFLAVVFIIQFNSAGKQVGSATGFYFYHNDRMYLITNKHVVHHSTNDPGSYLILKAHTDRNDLTKIKDIKLELNNKGSLKWICPKNPSIDIAAIYLAPEIINDAATAALRQESFPPKDVIISASDAVITLGYPLGFYDQTTFAATIKGGIIASYYGPFNNLPLFLLDANLLPGMSGGPVFTSPSMQVQTKQGVMQYAVPQRYFLGVHSASLYMVTSIKKEPVYEEQNGKIIIKELKDIVVNEKNGLQTCWFAEEIVKLIEGKN